MIDLGISFISGIAIGLAIGVLWIITIINDEERELIRKAYRSGVKSLRKQ